MNHRVLLYWFAVNYFTDETGTVGGMFQLWFYLLAYRSIAPTATALPPVFAYQVRSKIPVGTARYASYYPHKRIAGKLLACCTCLKTPITGFSAR
jgi:hypothetical protein